MNERKKLTTAAFKRKSCPKWARYAAVNRDGTAYYYDQEPDYDAVRGRWMYAYDRYCGEFDATDWKNSLIERPVTNLDWLCKHPQELAKRLVDFDICDRFCVAPDGKVFEGYAEEGGIYNRIDASKRCLKHTVKWLKLEHEKVKND
jgi:hypothetical protein